MALARDSRMDRRRRVLLDASAAEETEGGKRNSTQQNQSEGGKKGAGYSQDVRQACGTRLVQLIPVRKRSFTALVIASVSVTSVLLIAHYLVYVTGQLPWYGHPLAVALDATHPQSLAAWLGSHLWLMCLGATILTFQLRRHKLDDYRGEYRLWFWLVITCLIASIDSTTHITELFGQALDRWSKINIGWSGKAVVLATLSALIGMLGLRLCTELKSVPTSLVCWLLGLACWAGSAALGQEMLRLDMAIQTRIWLRAGLWLIGLTSIWIAAVAYLRHVYIEAQQRFLARGLLARRASAVPLKERVRQTIPFLRGRRDRTEEELEEGQDRKGWSLRGLLRRKPKPEASEAESARATKKSKSKPATTTSAGQPQTAQNSSSQPQSIQAQATRPIDAANRPQAAAAAPQAGATSSARPTQPPQQQTLAQVSNNTNANSATKRDTTASKDHVDEPEKKKRGWPLKFKFWPGKDVPEEDATEYQKLTREEKADEQRRVAEERKLEREMAKADKAKAKEVLAAQRAADKQAKKDAKQAAAANGEPKEGIGKKLLKPVAAVGGILKKIKLPSLSAFKLSPPDVEAEQSEGGSGGSTLRPANQNGPLPGTTSKPVAGPQLAQRANNANYQDDEDDEDDDRQMSKAERKKLRKQNRAA